MSAYYTTPAINTTLAWATPVSVETVGANLEAYTNLLPTVNTVRLCHRFGGSTVPLTRLPVELLMSIEDILVEQERNKTQEPWREAYLCSRGDCSPIDHFSKDALSGIRDEIIDQGYYVPLEGDDEEQFQAELNDYILEGDGHYDIHSGRKYSFEGRVQSLTKHESVLGRHFGLSLWTSKLRLGKESPADFYWPHEMTLAYLTLLGGSSYKQKAEYAEYEGENGPDFIETACVMNLEMPQDRPVDATARFKHAMKVLGLQVYEHSSQKDRTLRAATPSDQQIKERERANKEWPRLTVLVNTES